MDIILMTAAVLIGLVALLFWSALPFAVLVGLMVVVAVVFFAGVVVNHSKHTR